MKLEKISKKLFYRDKNDEMRMMIHKSIEISDDFMKSIIRFDKKNSIWKFQSKRLNRKISNSLQFHSMIESQENSREIIDEERFHSFEKFSQRLMKFLEIDQIIEIIEFLK